MDPAKVFSTALVALFAFYGFVLLLGLGYLALWLYSIYHCLTRGAEKDRALWILVISFVPFFGVIFYLVLGRNKTPDQLLVPRRDPPVVPVIDAHSAAVHKAANLAGEKARAEQVNQALSQQSARARKGDTS